MANFGKGITITSGFNLGAEAPLDFRSVVNTIEERDAHVTEGRAYIGMEVYVINENKKYRYNGSEWNEITGDNSNSYDLPKATDSTLGGVIVDNITIKVDENGVISVNEENILGVTGADGKSAYDTWLDAGNTGDEQAFLDSLKGEDGNSITMKESLDSTDLLPELDNAIGDTYLINGDMWIYDANELEEDDTHIKGFTKIGNIQGPKGEDGKSVYDTWLDAGNTGDEQAFLDSLKGEDGKSVYNTWLDAGNTGDEQAFLDSLKGEDGNSITMKESLDSTDLLPELDNVIGDTYLINGDMWTYDANELEEDDTHIKGFVNVGTVQGPTGDTGETGPTGPTGRDGLTTSIELQGVTYEHIDGTIVIDKINANTINNKSIVSLTQAEYNSLTPDENTIYIITDTTNEQGPTGPIGPTGDTGETGKSAYDIWKEINGDDAGDEQTFLDSLKGKDGTSISLKGSLENTDLLPTVDNLISDAYLIDGNMWVYDGNTLPEDETHKNGFVNVGTIQGPKGEDGKSAYNTWLDAGNTGEEQDFLDSLKGEPGTGVNVKGALLSTDDLPTTDNVNGDAYLINGKMWVYDANTFDDDIHISGFSNLETGSGGTITEDITVYGICEELGYKDGDIIHKGDSITEVLKKLLQKVIHPTYKKPSLNISVTPSLIEYNVEKSINIVPNFTKNNAGDIANYSVSRDGQELHTGGSELNSYTDTITPNSVGSITYKYTINYGDGEILKDNAGNDDETGRILAGSISKEASITVVYPTYVGVVDNDGVNEQNILNCEKLVRANTTLEHKFTANFKTIVFVTSGNLTSIINQNGYEVITNFVKETVNINGVDLNCYSLANVNVSDFNYKFIF